MAGGCTDHLKVSWAEGSTKKGAQRRQEHASDVPRERPEFSQLTMRGQHAAVCKQDVIDQQDGGILGQLSGHAPTGAVQHIASLQLVADVLQRQVAQAGRKSRFPQAPWRRVPVVQCTQAVVAAPLMNAQQPLCSETAAACVKTGRWAQWSAQAPTRCMSGASALMWCSSWQPLWASLANEGTELPPAPWNACLQ